MNNSNTRWRINYRFAAWFGGIVAVASVCLYFWHGHQYSRSAGVLLDRAHRQEQAEEWDSLVGTLRRYLQMTPEDDDAWRMLAKAEDRRADSFRGLVDAARVHGRVLTRPGLAGDVGLRIRYARLLLDTGRYDDAVAQAEQAANGGTAEQRKEAATVRALAMFDRAAANRNQADWSKVLEALTAAVKAQAPLADDLELSMRLAALYSDAGVKLPTPAGAEGPLSTTDRTALATKVMNDLVDRHPEDALVRLARYRYRTAIDAPDAKADLEAAVARADKDDVEVWITAADAAVAESRGQPEQLRAAQQYYESARAIAPLDRRVYIGLIRTLMLLESAQPNGQSVAKAEQVLHEALKQIGLEDFELKLWQGRIYIGSDQDKKFASTLDELNAIRASNQLAWSNAVRAMAQVEVDRLKADQLMARGNYAEAAELLERLARTEQGIAIDSDTRRLSWAGAPYQTWMSLGRCRDALMEADRAARAYEEALRLAPAANEARRAAARAWTAAGRPDLAAPHWELTSDVATGTDAIARLEFLIGRIRARRESERDWTEVRNQLATLQQQPDTRLRAYLLTAQVELERRDRAAALAAVQAAEQTPPRTASEWRSLVIAYQALEAEADVERALGEFGKLSTPIEVSLLRSDLLIGQQRYGAAEQILTAGKAAAQKPEDAAILDVAIAKLLSTQSRFAEAKSLLTSVAQQSSSAQREATRLLAGLCLQMRDWAELERQEEALKSMDGENSTEWRYFRANRLLQTSAAEPAALATAADFANAIAKERPDWLAGIQLQAEVAERQGKAVEAIAAYERAIALSAGTEMELRLGTRLVELAFTQLNADGKLSSSLQETLVTSPVLSAAAIARAVAEGRNELALQLATAAVQVRPRDPLAHFWLGQTQLLIGQMDAAAASLRVAIEGGADFTLAWESLFNLLATTGKGEQAAALVARIEQATHLPEPNRSLLLARAYALTGRAADADQVYRGLIERFPTDRAAVQAAVNFFAGRDLDLAEKLARDALQASPEDSDAKRLLASVLAARGSKAAFQEAAALLGASPDSLPLEESDLRTYAQLLSRRPEPEYRNQAIEILAGIFGKKAMVSAQDRLLLVGLYQSAGRHQEALAELITLSQASKIVVPDHLAALSEYAIAQVDSASAEQIAAANEALQELERREPNSWRTFALKLRSQRAQNPSTDVKTPLASATDRSFTAATTPAERASVLIRSADLCAMLDEPALAEQYLRRAAETAPEGRRGLALYLAAKGEAAATQEAVDLLLDAATAADATALCNVLTLSGADANELARAEPKLREALAKFPDDLGLQFAWGSLALVRGDVAQADAALRKTLQQAPANALAINNLAYLRVAQDQPAEALALAERAVAVGGPANNFVDTLGLAQLATKQFAEAIRTFKHLADVGKDPVSHLHLAQAEFASGDAAAAKASVAKAKELKLNPATLPDYDRRALATLEAALNH